MTRSGKPSDYCSNSALHTSKCQSTAGFTALYSFAPSTGSLCYQRNYSVFSPAASLLNPYVDYTFEMTLSGGNLHFYEFWGTGVLNPALANWT